MADADVDVLERAASWLAGGRKVAIATVVETWGSSPRPRGSQLAARDDGEFAGSVSGGCVEGKVVEAAREVLAGAPPRLLEFGVSNEEAWEVGLACGGTVRIFVSAQPACFEALLRARREKRPVVVLTDLDRGEDALVAPGDPPLDEPRAAAIARALATDDAFVIEGTRVFVQPHNPPLRLVVVGAVHIAEALGALARIAGYDVTIVDPREAFARRESLAGFRVVGEWPDEALAAMGIDHRTAIVTLTHDPKLDDPALEAALHSRAFYVGALGSGKTHAARLRRLAGRGLDEAALARIEGPVGLRIGARTPAEIAVSILAQMTERLRVGRVPKG
jgi:xanthine dehydrogenase accessory factor